MQLTNVDCMTAPVKVITASVNFDQLLQSIDISVIKFTITRGRVLGQGD